jgi:hypothetical protein
MKYVALINFDAGSGLFMKGQEYTGPDAEMLVKKGFLAVDKSVIYEPTAPVQEKPKKKGRPPKGK